MRAKITIQFRNNRPTPILCAFAKEACLNHDGRECDGANGMKRLLTGGLLLVAQIWTIAVVLAGPWEDGMAAYNRGDYVPAMAVFRALAELGNAEAQTLLGVMYRRGQGVKRSSARAYLWLSRAALRGNARAKTELREVSQAMTAEELAKAQEIAEACEASNYRTCEY